NIRIENKELEFIINNQYNKKLIQYINKDFEIENPKKIDEILKGIYRNREISTRQFQYISFANGIYHMGTGKDLLLYENKKLIEKNDKVESIGIFASLGFIDFYNPDKLCDALSEFIFAENNYRKSGSLLALAIAGCRTVDTNHTLLALISDSFMDDTYQKISAMLAINLTYSTSLYYSVDKSFPTKLNCNAKLGNQNKNENNFKGDNEEIKNKRKACDYDKIEEIKKLLSFTEKNLEEISMTLLTLSSIYAGTGDISISSRIVSKLLEYSDESDNIFYKIMILSLGLLYINTKGEFKQDQSFSILDFLENDAFDDYISNYIYVVIMGYSYAATSNTYIIEEILSIITSITTLRDVGYLMVALISIGDNTSSRMCMRLLGSDSENGRIAAIGLLYASNPLPEIIEFLSKKINTNTLPTIFTLGIIGCGTNNKNIIKLLEDNYSFYQKNTKVFSMMRMAKGLINAGRGIYGINIFPYNNIDIKTLVHLSTALFLILDGDNSINFQKYYFMNYLLAGTLTNKSITTIKINEDIENIEYTNTVISVGNPIDIVGMAGNPKKLSSIQSNASPVVLQVGENGELNDKDKTYTNVIEGVVIMK
ncbi:26S proteasome regulatory subunit 4, partial [Spraguea lophii 42_110]